MYHHKIDPRIFDDLFPWEKDIEINMIIQEVEEENLKRNIEIAKNRSGKAPMRFHKKR